MTYNRPMVRNTEHNRKRITVGILAHVDAGKTTLSEALLYEAGRLAKPGRVDHGDAFLDTDIQEKERGITIFSKQAQLDHGSTDIMLMDTPGHVDFSGEMERILSVLDYAILVISGKELVQGHTLTVWSLLQQHGIPTFLFVNKMDLEGTDQETALEQLRTRLDEGCVLFEETDADTKAGTGVKAGADTPAKAGRGSADAGAANAGAAYADTAEGSAPAADPEELAMCDEDILTAYLEEERIPEELIRIAIRKRRVFPCCFGSALKMEGTGAFLRCLDKWTVGYEAPEGSFSARVFKITRDEKGVRLTHMKILSGRLSARDGLPVAGGPEEVREKVHQIRIYSGEKYEAVSTADAGSICAVTGPETTFAGQLISEDGIQEADTQRLQPVLRYSVEIPENISPHTALQQMRQLEEEDPLLHVQWSEEYQEIQVSLMGEIQQEILSRQIRQRFGYEPAFSEGKVEYRETIAAPVRGAGHFEPLRHYAEVHLRLDPLPAGSGLKLASDCSSDDLDTNWQRLIMTHLTEREYPGVLTGSAITDMQITIEGGRAHLKHTEGGDFRQATGRAVRQALRKSEPVLLEPWYDVTIEVPDQNFGRVLSDIRKMGGTAEEVNAVGASGSGAAGGMRVLSGSAPVSGMRSWQKEFAAFTRGFGSLTCTFGGYRKCHNSDEVIEAIGYDPDRDTDNPADSVFCSHGAGRIIPWDEADEHMHVKITDKSAGASEEEVPAGGSMRPAGAGTPYSGSSAGGAFQQDRELQRIFERTYGVRNERPRRPARTVAPEHPKREKTRPAEVLPECLLVDGYNIIFAWEELRELAERSIDGAREALIEIMANYQGWRGCGVIVVFDAYKVKGGTEHIEEHGDLKVVYTKEAETADTYIERTTYRIGKKYHVRVATSDRLEQMIILGNDAFRVSARDLKAEIEEADELIAGLLQDRRRQSDRDFRRRLTLPEAPEEETERKE